MFLKALKLTVVVGALAITSACKHSHDHSQEQDQTNSTLTESQKQSKEYASAYICPMHCKGSGSDQAGKCPVCGMDYVENKNAPKKHDHNDDHDHDDHEGHDHD